MLNAVMLSVVMLNVVILRAVAPLWVIRVSRDHLNDSAEIVSSLEI
jgi:hypothetical protein